MNIKGIKTQLNIIIKPTKIIKANTNTLSIIKTILQIAPMILEKKLEINVLRYSVILKNLGYPQLYFFHGENNVASNKGAEKKIQTKYNIISPN